jgi:hypothetical protein
MPGREDASEYRLRAQHCLDIAKDAASSRKLILLEMAQAWLRLAALADRNRKNDLWYETPRPKRGARPVSK